MLAGQAITERDTVGVTAAALAFSGSSITETRERLRSRPPSLAFVGQEIEPTEVTDATVVVTSLALAFSPQPIGVNDNELVEAASLSFLGGEITIRDELAVVIPPGAGVGFLPARRPIPPVIGEGYGILPELEGEAHGIVTIAGTGVGAIRLVGEAHGVVGAAGLVAARIVVDAKAIGDCGEVGDGVAILKSFAMGFWRCRGARLGLGHDRETSRVSANGRHDNDDEGAVMIVLAA